jgi:hypothetical protein
MNTLIVELAALSVFAFAFVLFAVQVVALEIGLRFGQRGGRSKAAPREGVGVVVGGMLGLLGFVLALTLSYSSQRFQERRQGVVAEANAIGTAWLRAQAVGGPRGGEIARLLEDYTRLRVEFVQAGKDAPTLAEINRRTSAMQSAMWGHATALVRERPDAVIASLLAALNETFDLGTVERFAFGLGIPPLLFWLLTGMSTVAIMGLGYQLGLRNQHLRLMSLMLLGMWTAIITIILDLGAPRIGDIRVGTVVYEWTLQGFEGGLAIPPLPPR